MRRMRIASFSRSGSRRNASLGIAGGLLLALCAPSTAPAQSPAAMNEAGCCCVSAKDGSTGCGQKTQKECLSEQAKMPTFDKLPEWAEAVERSQAQENVKMKTGWKVGKCGS